MPLQITADTTIASGQTVSSSNELNGVLIVSAAGLDRSPSLTIAGTLLHTTNWDNQTRGIAHLEGGFFQSSVVTIQSAGVFRVTANGTGTAFGMWSIAEMANLVNHGLFQVSAFMNAFGVFTADSMSYEFLNAGTLRVTSLTNDAWGLYSQNGGLVTNSGLMEITAARYACGIHSERATAITNSGTLRVTGTGPEGVSIGILVANARTESATIVNTGTIEADLAIVDGADPNNRAVQTVANSGTIHGVIDLGGGNDRLENSGTIRGEVYLSFGADTYVGGSGQIIGAVHGEFGDDTLTGGAFADALYGEEGNDVIDGGGGDDVLQGGRGDNRIDGGSGIDTLIYAGLTIGVDLDLAAGSATAAGVDVITGIENVWGSRWADRLKGDVNANLLYGADGADTLDGRAGDDRLIGGLGADILTGGTGADVFVFGSGDGADEILDFSGDDAITIHGYAAAQEIRQVGADTLVVLSATDSILLRNTMASAIGASQITFSAQTRPTYTAPYQRPAELSDASVQIHETFQIRAGERIDLNGDLGGLAVYIVDGDIAPGVINAGHVRVSGSTAAGVGLGGVPATTAFFNNLAGGVLEVVATGSGQRGGGVTAEVFGARVSNAGLIDVRSAGLAYGAWSYNLDMRVVNEGTIHVEGGRGAYGVNLGAVGQLVNSGVIDVTGRNGDVFGVRGISQTSITNTGSIIVNRTDGDGVGLYVRADGYTINNGGLIDADIAIDAGPYSSNAVSRIINTGEIRGRVQMSGTYDVFTNNGLTTGVIAMGNGQNIFDGSGGQQIGQVQGGLGRDQLIGGALADDFDGGDQSDTLTGGGGDDRLNGGSGDDFAVFRGPRSAYSWVVNGSQITVTGPDGVDTLIDIELLQFDDELVSLTGFGIREKGGNGDDTINGTSLNDVLDGGDIPPLMVANGLNDNGSDRLYGHGGDDVLTGGGGRDYLYGGVGNDLLNGGDYNDELYGEDGDDRLIGDRYDDILDGGAGMDTAVYLGAASAYSITVSGSSIRVTGPGGPSHRDGEFDISTDTLTGVEFLEFADQTIRIGTVGDDVLSVTANVSRIDGLTGNDTIYGGAGTDILSGGSGADILDGSLGDDLMYGGTGNDTFYADTAADLVFEGLNEGTDTVIASAGYYLYANIEDLTLAAGAGDIFGVGNELANVITGNKGGNLLIAGAGNDTVHGGAGNDSLYGQDGDDILNGDAGIDYLVGGIGNDVIDGGTEADALYGEDGADTLIGGAGFFTDILVGGAGNDILRGDSTLGDYDLMDGGSGDDAYYVDTGDDLTFEAVGGGTDTVYADVRVTNGGVYLYANVENLVLIGTTAFGVGNELNNVLTGNVSANYLLGGAGNDRLNGGAGGDVLFGEAGQDVFAFSVGSGGDVIGDFNMADDRMDVSAFFTSFAQVQANFSQVGADGAINLGGGDFIVLHGVTMANLTASHFIFGGAAPQIETEVKDAGAQILPGLADDGFLLTGKDGAEPGPQILPGPADDGADFLFDLGGDTVGAGDDMPVLHPRLAMLFVEAGEQAPDGGHDAGPLDLHHNPDPWAA